MGLRSQIGPISLICLQVGDEGFHVVGVGAFEENVTVEERVLLEIGTEVVHCGEDRVWGGGGAVFVTNQEDPIRLALRQHIDDVLVLQMRIVAQLTHRPKDIRIARKGTNRRLHRRRVGIVCVHNEVVVRRVHGLRAAITGNVSTYRLQALLTGYAKVFAYTERGRDVLRVVVADKVGTSRHGAGMV